MSDGLKRVLTALVGAPVLLGLLYLGGWVFGGLVVLLALGAQYELYQLMARRGVQPYVWVGLGIGALVALRPLLPWAPVAALVGVVLLVAASPLLRTDGQPFEELGGTIFGLIYPTALLSFLTDLRLARGPGMEDLDAFFLTLSTFLLIWATDTFAYYVGKNLGKHPLAPKVSPKKTWEGSVGGAAGAVGVAVILKLTLLDFLAWPHILVMALLCGVVSQLGDLAESRLKRAVGAKDSGTLLPGHGGLLDRFDAMILAAPLVYFYLAYVAGVFA